MATTNDLKNGIVLSDLAKPTVLAGPDMQLLVGAFGEISG